MIINILGGAEAILSDTEILRLKELERMFSEESQAKAGKNAKMRRSMKFYSKENQKMKRALKHKRAKIGHVYMHSRALEDLYEVERRQTKAANIIQRAYRRYK